MRLDSSKILQLRRNKFLRFMEAVFCRQFFRAPMVIYLISFFFKLKRGGGERGTNGDRQRDEEINPENAPDAARPRFP